MTSDTFDSGIIEAERRYAGFGVRLGAYIIDILALLPLIGATIYFTSFSPNPVAYLGIAMLMSLYKPVMEGLYGATLGKMAVKIKVIEGDGGPIDLQQAFIRWIPFFIGGAYGIYSNYSVISAAVAEGISGYMEFNTFQAQYIMEQGATYWLGSVLGIIPLISVLFLLGNNFKQALHDKWAKTYVVYKEPKQSSVV